MKTKYALGILLSLLIPLMALKSAGGLSNGKVVIGYVGGYKGLINTAAIEVQKVTHLNYAFVNVRNNRAVLGREATDTINLKNLSALKTKKQQLKILLSIGGWAWSKNFSDAAWSDTSRKAFAKSAVALAARFKMDGIDIDWEYPGISANKGNIYRKEDKGNFTLLLKSLREQLDSLGQKENRTLLLTVAVGGFSNFIKHTEMDKAQLYLDFVNLMTYDFYPGQTAVHHTNLYPSKQYSGNSADRVVKEFTAAGVPAAKLVMGIAFYGQKVKLKENSFKGLTDTVLSAGYGKGYTFIKDSLINKKGFVSYRDKAADAAYIYNPETLELMSYDDERSVKAKCKYVKKQGMAGVMFWEYDADLNGYLLEQIHKSLK